MSARTLLRLSVLLAFLLLVAPRNSAQEPRSTSRPEPLKEAPQFARERLSEAPRLVIKNVPESVEDLRDLEQRVQEVVARVAPSVVGLQIGGGQGSGVIIKDGYVLTAGHVSGQPGNKASITLPGGKQIKGKALGRNTGIDSGLIQITDEGKYPAVEVGNSSELKKGQWVVVISHPGGFRLNRGPVVRVGRVLLANNNVIRTDCVLVGGDSGGPVFDLEGRVVGINSRIGTELDQNMHVPVDTFASTWARLARGESWGGAIGSSQPVTATPGGKIVFEKADSLTTSDPPDTRRTSSHFKVYEHPLVPTSCYTIDMTGGDPKKPFDPFLRLEESTGKDLTEDDDGGGNMNARIVFRPERAGTYRIVASTFDPKQTGPFKLSIREYDLKDQIISGEGDALKAFTVPRELVPLLWAKVNRTSPVLLRGTLLDAKSEPVANKELLFRWPGGERKHTSNAKGEVLMALGGSQLKELRVDVPEGLRLLLELTGADGKPVFNSVAPTLTSAGGAIVLEASEKLSDSDTVDRLRPGFRQREHMFKMTAGSTYTIDLESTAFDAYLRLEASNGLQLAADDDSAGNFNARILHRAAREDTVRIIVTSSEPGQTGAYRLTVRQADKKEKTP
jgi:S1-C subfamily serine protease